MEKLAIRDQLFSHAYSTSNWFKPAKFEWDFTGFHGDFIFLTDLNVHQVEDLQLKQYKKYAWLVESPVITPQAYDYVERHQMLFDGVFTHSAKLLLHPNTYLVPIGGCHIAEEDIHLNHDKIKLVSMMYSNKNFVEGHAVRHQIAKIDGINQLVDVMGSGVNGQYINKIESCRDYAFSVVAENCREGYYFTEKIVDCFLTGTVPIYWGCPKIDQFFNPDGFLKFDTIGELHRLLLDREWLGEFYNSHHSQIIENYNLALQYKVAEDYLYDHYRDML